MLPSSFLQLHTAMYEWTKECPQDLKKELELFFSSKEFLDRPDVFFKGVEDSSQKWVALISLPGLEQTHTMLCGLLQYEFLQLHEARGVTFSQIAPAPRMSLQASYNKFIKDVIKANKILKNAQKVRGWTRELDRATEMILLGPKDPALATQAIPSTETTTTTSVSTDSTKDASVSGKESAVATKPRLMSPVERAAAKFGMWFISVDIESFEFEHSKILEIGWSIWDSRVNKFLDRHYAISEYRHLKNGKFVADRRDRFLFGETVWATLKESIAAFQDDLITASQRNAEGVFALIAHDMASDAAYLRGMGVEFPKRGMIKFDTLELNGARTGDTNMTGLGKLLDQLDIENYCLHNAGNDAHYTLELFLWLARNRAAEREQVTAEATQI